MIKNIKFSNFYSFDGEQEISFVAKKKNTYDYFQSKSGDQITKVAGFIGSNASGKTNIMRLFSFLRYFITTSSKDDSADSNIAYKTFFNNEKPSKFGIEFEIENSSFFYEFNLHENRVLSEKLSIKKNEKNSRRIIVFSRKLKGKPKFSKHYFENFPKSKIKIRDDVSLIAYLKANYKIDVIDIVHGYFSKFQTNINERGERTSTLIGRRGHSPLAHQLGDSTLKQMAEDFIRNFDVGLNGFELKEEIKGRHHDFEICGIHSTKEKNNTLDFTYESQGTRSLFYVLLSILVALKRGGVVIIDEIESGFHPEALNKIVSYFIDENKDGKAQLIFSSHSLGFMNKLDMHQIYLVEKDKESRSYVYRLNQVEGVRPDENFIAKYMSGSYGAFPKITV
jgi:hypothetical protein